MTPEERRIWAAGMLDGDGWMSMKHYSDEGRPKLRTRVGVTNTDERIILEFAEFCRDCGIRPCISAKKPASFRDEQAYQVVVKGLRRVSTILTALQPYLVGKRERARLVLELARYRLALPNRYASRDDKWFMRQLVAVGLMNQCGASGPGEFDPSVITSTSLSGVSRAKGV